MIPNPTYEQACKKAYAIKALSNNDIYLSEGDMPWHIATNCEPGGTHRLEMSTSLWFRGYDPEVDLNFRWSFDIEPYSSNGKGFYEIDYMGCRDVLMKLNGECRKEFQEYLLNCSKRVKEKADEWRKIADRQELDAGTLYRLATLEESQ